MKTILLVLGVLGLITGCGRSDNEQNKSDGNQNLETHRACASSTVVGRWVGTVAGQKDVLSFNFDCTGNSSYCGSSFRYPNTSDGVGSVEIDVTSTAGNFGCLPLGKRPCSYSIRDNTLQFNCGGSTLTYLRGQSDPQGPTVTIGSYTLAADHNAKIVVCEGETRCSGMINPPGNYSADHNSSTVICVKKNSAFVVNADHNAVVVIDPLISGTILSSHTEHNAKVITSDASCRNIRR